jgi:hypothetical protein
LAEVVVVSAAYCIRRCLMDLNCLLMEEVAAEAARLLQHRATCRRIIEPYAIDWRMMRNV